MALINKWLSSCDSSELALSETYTLSKSERRCQKLCRESFNRKNRTSSLVGQFTLGNDSPLWAIISSLAAAETLFWYCSCDINFGIKTALKPERLIRVHIKIVCKTLLKHTERTEDTKADREQGQQRLNKFIIRETRPAAVCVWLCPHAVNI